MDALAQELYAEHDQVKKILSYTDLLKRLNQLFHADESALGLPAKVAVGMKDYQISASVLIPRRVRRVGFR
jgi:hypothetical protein